MPIFKGGRPGRRRRRVLALVATAVTASALIGPSTASAGDDWFCGGVWLDSTQQCRAEPQRWLWAVHGYVANGSPYRICSASAVSAWGPQNSDFRCDYGSVAKAIHGSAYGVGIVRNGSPFWFQVAVGIQTW
jgi:hypothetical protein